MNKSIHDDTRDGKPNYRIECSDGTADEWKSPTDAAALSKAISYATKYSGEGKKWKLYFKGPRENELIYALWELQGVLHIGEATS